MALMVNLRPGPTAMRSSGWASSRGNYPHGSILRSIRAIPSSIRNRGIATNVAVQEPSADYPGVGEFPPASQAKRLQERKDKIKNAKPFSEFLTDSFNRQHDYLRISITERCNLRCLYCMPEEGVPLSPPAHSLTTPEIFYLSSLFVSQGVTKIRLTGGEPTVRRDIIPLMQQIGSLRPQGLRELALTTNGISLHRKLDSMIEAGLTGINLSLDTLDPFQFQIMTRRKGFDAVMKSIDRVLELKKLGANLKLKVNCVVMRGLNERDIIPFVELGREKDIEVRFIEYMPFGGNKWSENKMISFQEMVDIIRTKYPGLKRVPGHKNDTSKTFEVPGFVGKVGFITSMTNDFCGTCNRLRITSDGNLKVCLHGNAEVSLRDVLRQGNDGQPIDQEAFERIKQIEMDRRDGRLSDETVLGWGQRERELLEVIGAAVKRKAEKHADMDDLSQMENRPMILIDLPIQNHPLSSISPTRSSHRAYHPSVALVHPWYMIPPPRLNSFYPSIISSNTLFVRSFSTKTQRPKSISGSSIGDQTTVHQQLNRNAAECTVRRPKTVFNKRTKMVSDFQGGLELNEFDVEMSWLRNEETDPHLRKILAPSNGKLPPFSTPFPWQMRVDVGIRRVEGSTRCFFKPAERRYTTKAKTNTPQSPRNNDIILEEPNPTTKVAARPSNALPHLTPSGSAHMVSVTSKPNTVRTAIAVGSVHFSNAQPLSLIRSNSNKKGDVLSVSRIAGIMAAKKCPDIIPLCHPINLSHVGVILQLFDESHGGVTVQAKVECTGGTGVEMEALTAVMGAALTVVDMCKAVDKGMRVEGVRVTLKEGGRSGTWKEEGWKEIEE